MIQGVTEKTFFVFTKFPISIRLLFLGLPGSYHICFVIHTWGLKLKTDDKNIFETKVTRRLHIPTKFQS